MTSPRSDQLEDLQKVIALLAELCLADRPASEPRPVGDGIREVMAKVPEAREAS